MREDYVYRDYPGVFEADKLKDLMVISKRMAKVAMSDGSKFVRFEYRKFADETGKEWITDVKIVSTPKKDSK